MYFFFCLLLSQTQPTHTITTRCTIAFSFILWLSFFSFNWLSWNLTLFISFIVYEADQSFLKRLINKGHHKSLSYHLKPVFPNEIFILIVYITFTSWLIFAVHVREEIQRIKAANPEIPHREAFSAAAKNVIVFYSNPQFRL